MFIHSFLILLCHIICVHEILIMTFSVNTSENVLKLKKKQKHALTAASTNTYDSVNVISSYFVFRFFA